MVFFNFLNMMPLPPAGQELWTVHISLAVDYMAQTSSIDNNSSRFDSGFRDYGGDQEPHMERAIHAVRFVAQHVKNQNRYDKVCS